MTPRTPPTRLTPTSRRGAPHFTDAAFWTAFVVLFGVALALIHAT